MKAADEAVANAKEALERDDKAEAVKHLQSIPPKLLSAEAQDMLARVNSFMMQLESLDEALRKAIDAKDWPLTGAIISQLLELAPEEQQFLRLAKNVAERLNTRVTEFASQGKYERGGAVLGCDSRANVESASRSSTHPSRKPAMDVRIAF